MAKANNAVRLWNQVVIRDLSTGRFESYQLVPPHELDLLNNKISADSALGTQLIGKHQGEIVRIINDEGKEFCYQIALVGESPKDAGNSS